MAETTTTTNMGLVLPTPGQRLGPTWASDLNAALTLVDSHDHTSGKGVTLGVASFTIDADVNYNNNYALLNANYLGFDETATPSTDFPAASKPSILFSGGAVNVPASAVASKSFAVNTTLVSVTPFNSTSTPALAEADGYNVYFLNYSTGAATITLPTMAGMPAGRMFTFKDINGNASTNPINILPTGTETIDGISAAAGGVTLVSAYESASFVCVGDGTRWARI